LLVRYEHELRSLQAEDFIERIQSWRSELEAIVTVALRAIIEPLTREIDRRVLGLVRPIVHGQSDSRGALIEEGTESRVVCAGSQLKSISVTFVGYVSGTMKYS
jgi:hypothetical protein